MLVTIGALWFCFIFAIALKFKFVLAFCEACVLKSNYTRTQCDEIRRDSSLRLQRDIINTVFGIANVQVCTHSLCVDIDMKRVTNHLISVNKIKKKNLLWNNIQAMASFIGCATQKINQTNDIFKCHLVFVQRIYFHFPRCKSNYQRHVPVNFHSFAHSQKKNNSHVKERKKNIECVDDERQARVKARISGN